ncbi:P-loop NTPase fold protein [Bradyrhizobium sp. Arg816]|uniref:KAP family P-loop NTPase fold protein n=1 Tax=Bradyrhizobium sp. Arg816 TaxID=2998491 RepID=UPI00249DA9BB|nr:P-loop NTPase fold protein [Bradyrhizobium sp. Arg816]MDI3560404.1 P-loop NTPase fold protein [Bradyrhizobium sp. Arg816]
MPQNKSAPATEPGTGEIWTEDKLGRSEEAAFLKSFLLNRVGERKRSSLPASYVLNIDAEWGQGKSFFLSRFGRMLRKDGFIVAEVNAWQDDHADDPLLSVMDAIDQAVAPLVKREKKVRERWNEAKRTGAAIAVAAAKGATVQIARKFIGSGVDEIGTILSIDAPTITEKLSDEAAKSLGEIVDEQGKVLLARFRQGKRTIDKFRTTLDEFLQEAAHRDQALPLFVLIDELDRCRPPFAIAMLERVKHLFEIDQLVFVVATDTPQLSHSVGAIYGGAFNSAGYLSRFFNRTYYFDQASRKDFVEDLLTRTALRTEKLSLPPRVDLIAYLSECFDFFGLALRDIEQIYDILRSVVTVWANKSKLEICVLFPIAVAHQQRWNLPFDRNFSSSLGQLRQRLGGTGNWSIQFPSPHYGQPSDGVSGLSLASEFVIQSERGLHDINHEGTSAHSRWVAQQLSAEFATNHGNSWIRGSEPFSIVRQYPEMVRSAGRLLPQTGKVD